MCYVQTHVVALALVAALRAGLSFIVSALLVGTVVLVNRTSR